MSRLVNAYTIKPHELRPGDEMLFTVKAIVMYDGTYRLYRCPYDGPQDVDRLPQGARISPTEEKQVAEGLFPSLACVSQPDSMQ